MTLNIKNWIKIQNKFYRNFCQHRGWFWKIFCVNLCACVNVHILVSVQTVVRVQSLEHKLTSHCFAAGALHCSAIPRLAGPLGPANPGASWSTGLQGFSRSRLPPPHGALQALIVLPHLAFCVFQNSNSGLHTCVARACLAHLVISLACNLVESAFTNESSQIASPVWETPREQNGTVLKTDTRSIF